MQSPQSQPSEPQSNIDKIIIVNHQQPSIAETLQELQEAGTFETTRDATISYIATAQERIDIANGTRWMVGCLDGIISPERTSREIELSTQGRKALYTILLTPLSETKLSKKRQAALFSDDTVFLGALLEQAFSPGTTSLKPQDQKALQRVFTDLGFNELEQKFRKHYNIPPGQDTIGPLTIFFHTLQSALQHRAENKEVLI